MSNNNTSVSKNADKYVSSQNTDGQVPQKISTNSNSKSNNTSNIQSKGSSSSNNARPKLKSIGNYILGKYEKILV